MEFTIVRNETKQKIEHHRRCPLPTLKQNQGLKAHLNRVGNHINIVPEGRHHTSQPGLIKKEVTQYFIQKETQQKWGYANLDTVKWRR